MALRGRAVVALVERQGGYYTDVVYDARTIMRALQRTYQSRLSVQPVVRVTGWNPLVAGRFCVARWLKVVVVRF